MSCSKPACDNLLGQVTAKTVIPEKSGHVYRWNARQTKNGAIKVNAKPVKVSKRALENPLLSRTFCNDYLSGQNVGVRNIEKGTGRIRLTKGSAKTSGGSGGKNKQLFQFGGKIIDSTRLVTKVITLFSDIKDSHQIRRLARHAALKRFFTDQGIKDAEEIAKSKGRKSDAIMMCLTHIFGDLQLRVGKSAVPARIDHVIAIENKKISEMPDADSDDEPNAEKKTAEARLSQIQKLFEFYGMLPHLKKITEMKKQKCEIPGAEIVKTLLKINPDKEALKKMVKDMSMTVVLNFPKDEQVSVAAMILKFYEDHEKDGWMSADIQRNLKNIYNKVEGMELALNDKDSLFSEAMREQIKSAYSYLMESALKSLEGGNIDAKLWANDTAFETLVKASVLVGERVPVANKNDWQNYLQTKAWKTYATQASQIQAIADKYLKMIAPNDKQVVAAFDNSKAAEANFSKPFVDEVNAIIKASGAGSATPVNFGKSSNVGMGDVEDVPEDYKD